MTWGDPNHPNSGVRSNLPIFPPIFTIDPLESPLSSTTRLPMDPDFFSPNDPAVDVIPMFEDSSQTYSPPDEELFIHVNFDGESDGPDGDEEG
jgi:hypothetical protein